MNAQRDLDTLTALNLDFFASVQKGDVKRFEEILADDFMSSHPDGSLLNKAEFLKLTAQPVTISGPRDCPTRSCAMRSWSTRRWQKGLPRSFARCPSGPDFVSGRSLIPQPELGRLHDPDDESGPPDGQGPLTGTNAGTIATQPGTEGA